MAAPPKIALALLALLATLALAGCGVEHHEVEVAEGEPVELGALEYNVLFTRFLNPNDPEDRFYIVDQPQLDPDELWLGVFMQVENTGEEPATLPRAMTVVDTEGAVYYPVDNESDFDLPLGAEVPAGGEVPEADTPAASGAIEGSLVLFRVPEQVQENRPLELVIPGEGGPARVELDI